MSIPFPPLFVCACAKDWSVEQGRGCWNPIGIRLFNDWELEHVKRLLSLLRGKKVIGHHNTETKETHPILSFTYQNNIYPKWH